MPGSSGEKLCPICDSPIQPGSKKCSFCGTDLSIFDIEVEKKPERAEPTPTPPRQSIESRVREVLTPPAAPAPTPQPSPAPEPEPEPETVEEPATQTARPMADQEPVTSEETAPPTVEEPMSPVEPPVQTPAHEYFECPECGTKVEVHASSCPGCGVMFADEGSEMFQCPACNALVSIDSKTCPGCGAMFVESEDDAKAGEPRPQPEVEAPIAEVRRPPSPEPVQQQPVQPAPEPTRTPYRAVREEPEPPAVEESAGRKGLGGFGWLKKLRKDAEQPAEPQERPAETRPYVPERSYAEPTRAPEPRPEMRAPPQPAPTYAQRPQPRGDSKDKGKELARMVAEMKPLLALANEKDIDIAESKKLIDEAAEAGRDRQIDRALEFVNRSKGILMTRIDEHLASAMIQLREEANVARSLGGDVSRALTYLGEIEKAKAAGDAEAAFVYAEKVSNELLPITGRYKEAKDRTAALKSLVADCEMLLLDTKEARAALSEAGKAFEANDFDKVEMLVKQATDRLYRAIPDRVNEEMHAAKAQLIEAKMKNVNTTPMITILKSVRTLMKAGDYQQALREMKEFKEQIRKVM